jgi:hypothetical protein
LRVLGGVEFFFILSFSYSVCFGFDLFFLFSLVYRFLCLLLALQLFPLLNDLLELFLTFFGLLVVLHRVLDSNFNFVLFVVNELIKGEIEKASDQFLGLIVMSH